MKRCDHSHWLSFDTCGNETSLLESDRLQTLTHHLQNPDTQQPRLFVLIGNASKSLALRELFGTKKAGKFRKKRHVGEIHLHLDPSSIFHNRPVLIADGDLPQQVSRAKAPSAQKCHETIRRAYPRPGIDLSSTLDGTTDTIYSRLLLPFADVFCFFSADLGGFRQIVRHLAVWLEKGQPSTLPSSTYPKIIIVTEKIPLGAEREKEAKKAFLWLLREETTHDLSEQISDIHVVALLPVHKVSRNARYRRLKECLLNRSDEVQRNKEDARSLFSATHFNALFRYVCDHFSQTSKEPFDFIRASRKQNPINNNLAEHISNLLKHIKSAKELMEFAVPTIASSFLLDNYPPESHMFDSGLVFRTLYKDALYQVSGSRVIAFEGSPDVVLVSGFINGIESQLRELFQQLTHGGTTSADIHRSTLRRFAGRWRNINSSSTCYTCLRRRPQHGLECGHINCENCVVVFGDDCKDDPWIFKIHNCFLCEAEMPEVVVKVHPPTAGVGVLCIDGGGTRGVLPLKFMKRIEDRIGLPMPLQNFFKVAFGISSGGLIVMAMFINGWSIDKSTESFEKLAKVAFKRRKVLDIPFLSRIHELLKSYLADGLYPAENIEAALQAVFGKDKTILDYSHATSIGARVGLPVATIREPSSCIFTNYNGVGTRDQDQGYHVIRPEDGYGKVRLWEIARSASAAPGFFPPKKIDGVGTFQDAGPLENDPLISALSEVAAMFPLVEEPDFMVSLGTGAPRTTGGKPSMSVSGPLSVWKDGAFPRLWRMFWERMRDRHVKQVFRTHPRYHRLDTEFDGEMPRLDNTKKIHELQLKAQEDNSVSKVIDNIARCAIASVFYFELSSVPEGCNGEYTGFGIILCSIRRGDPAFEVLLNQLSKSSSTFYLNNCPIHGAFGDGSFIGEDGNFRKRVELNLGGRFTISLKQGDSEPCNISGSPYSIEKLITAQGLNAYFGRADHGKRKRPADGELTTRKRQHI
ncbi:acyl transferase/acyl hydrolase/lysophospholipase [Tricladium varicosporioides]|nr:acyl transferase/acyl hydrolase/lysophospholipase [Hymenoscyphus varicosporioides]